jgi:hypothetical protein
MEISFWHPEKLKKNIPHHSGNSANTARNFDQCAQLSGHSPARAVPAQATPGGTRCQGAQPQWILGFPKSRP